MLFASPANPTGAVIPADELSALVRTAEELGIAVISDEIYHRLAYAAPDTTALAYGSGVTVINSFSKYYCMTGWRIGWMVLPGDLVRRAEILQQNLFISAPTLSQIAATVALGERDYSEVQKAGYAANRQLLSDGLHALGFDIGAPSDGAFYAYAGVSRFSNDSMQFCTRMLDEAGVAATPGEDFDRVNGKKFVRFSYAGKRETIELALERMKGFLGQYHAQ